MKATNYEVLVAFKVNKAEIELAGTIDAVEGEETVVNIGLTEASREHLQHTKLGNLKETIAELFGQFELGEGDRDSFLDQLGKQLEPLGDIYDAVFDLDIYLTDLAFHTGVEIRVGVMVKTEMKVGPIACERAAVTAVFDLSAEPETE